MDEIIDRRNKAVTFIALSDLLRHRPNKQKAKLIVPDHIGAVTPAPDPAPLLFRAHPVVIFGHTALRLLQLKTNN